MKASEILRAAKALIDTPEKWTRDCAARDAEGLPCSVQEKAACKFCSIGALAKVEGNQDLTRYLRAAIINASKVDESSFGVSIVTFNDHRADHPQVMAMWDRAIALAEADEAASQEDA